jgi:hypothetical protein
MDAKKFAEFSFEDKRRMVQEAISNTKSGKVTRAAMPESYPWIRDMFADRVVVEDGGKLFEYPYTLAADGAVTLGDSKPVKIAYEALAELRDVEIVKTGDHVAMDGSKVTYLEADLDEMIKNAGELKDTVKPPIVVSHADGDAGAAINAATVGAQQVGWMDPINLTKKKNADGSVSLFANFKDIAKNAVDKIGTELKRVSAEVYKNYKAGEKEFGKVIRRVSFVPIPSIKDMADVTQAHLVFGETPDQPTTWVTLSEAAPKSAAPPAAAPAAGDGTNVPPDGGKETTDMDIEKLAEQVTALTENVTKLQDANTAKDAEIAALRTEKDASVTRLSEVEERTRREDIDRFLEGRINEGKLSPALRVMGLDRFMQGLDDHTVVKFGEKSAEITPLQFMKRFLFAIPKNSILRLGEMGGPGGDPNKGKEQKIVDRTQLAEMTPADQAKFFKDGGKVID